MTQLKADGVHDSQPAEYEATRRSILKQIPALTSAMAALAGARPALARTAIELPERPCGLSRTLTRSLLDGRRIRVERKWLVSFAQESTGQIAISGEQTLVRVDAPSALAPLAAIEESRSTANMWPIRLTESGLVAAAGRGIRQGDIDEALLAAQQMVAEHIGERSAQSMIRDFGEELQRGGSSLLDRLPDDLFFPTVGPIRASRVVELPGGQSGEFEVMYEARKSANKGWLDRAERQVSTRFDGTEQIAHEEWSLSEE